MRRHTLKRLTGLGLFVATLAVIAWGIAVGHQARSSKQPAPELRAEELKPILDELRSSGSTQTLQRFEGWMAKNIVRGRTSEGDIVACFGKDFKNLDRPKRDRI